MEKGAIERKKDNCEPRSELDLIIGKKIHDYFEKGKLDSELAKVNANVNHIYSGHALSYTSTKVN